MRKIILIAVMLLLSCSQALGAVYYAVHVAGSSEDVRVWSVDVEPKSADVLSWDFPANWEKAASATTTTSLDALVNSVAAKSLVMVSSGDYKLTETLKPKAGTIMYGGHDS